MAISKKLETIYHEPSRFTWEASGDLQTEKQETSPADRCGIMRMIITTVLLRSARRNCTVLPLHAPAPYGTLTANAKKTARTRGYRHAKKHELSALRRENALRFQ